MLQLDIAKFANQEKRKLPISFNSSFFFHQGMITGDEGVKLAVADKTISLKQETKKYLKL